MLSYFSKTNPGTLHKTLVGGSFSKRNWKSQKTHKGKRRAYILVLGAVTECHTQDSFRNKCLVFTNYGTTGTRPEYNGVYFLMRALPGL